MTDKGKKIVYGKVASQFKDAFLADEMQKLTRPPEAKKEEPKKPYIVSNPYGVLIGARLRRFKPVIEALTKNFCLRLISREDYILSLRRECGEMMKGVQQLYSYSVSSDNVKSATNDAVDMAYKMTEGIKRPEMDIQMAQPLIQAILSSIGESVEKYTQNPLKKSEGSADNKIKGTFLSRFPEHIRKAIYQRLTMIGLNPNDEVTLKRLARNLGADPDKIIEQLEKGIIPDELKGWL
jgi:hypothetical protein